MKIGFHAVNDRDFFDALKFAGENGFDYVQFDLGVPQFFLENLGSEEIRRIKDFAEEKSVGISFHAPGDNVTLFVDYPSIRRGTLDLFCRIMEVAEKLAARHVTVHTGSYPQFKNSGEKYDAYSMSRSSYYEKILYHNLDTLLSASNSVMLCVENSDLTAIAINAIRSLRKDGKPIFLALDIAKNYTKSLDLNKEVAGFMERFSNIIREVHIHDMNLEYGSHQALGTGNIDFQKYKEIIKSPDVWVTVEVRPREEAARSKIWLLDMLRGNDLAE